MCYILCDIGGTKTRVAVTSDLEKFEAVEKYNTPTDFKKGIDQLTEAASKLAASRRIRGFTAGIRGSLAHDKRSLAHDNILTNWVDESLADKLSEKLSTTVTLENDTALAGLGEAVFGAAKGQSIVVYHAISTGVGGVKIEDGQIDQAAGGFEPGHQILDIDKTILGEEVEPTLENLVSGSAVEARVGIKPFDIPQTDTLWDQLAYYLAHGLRNSVLYWSPDVIVLGGAMIVGNPCIEIDAVTKYTNEVLGEAAICPLILRANLGDEAGLYGAMALMAERV